MKRQRVNNLIYELEQWMVEVADENDWLTKEEDKPEEIFGSLEEYLEALVEWTYEHVCYEDRERAEWWMSHGFTEGEAEDIINDGFLIVERDPKEAEFELFEENLMKELAIEDYEHYEKTLSEIIKEEFFADETATDIRYTVYKNLSDFGKEYMDEDEAKDYDIHDDDGYYYFGKYLLSNGNIIKAGELPSDQVIDIYFQ